MPGHYELAVLGEPSAEQVKELKLAIQSAIDNFGMKLGVDVQWHVKPPIFRPEPTHSAAAVFFGKSGVKLPDAEELFRRGISLVPVASDLRRVKAEIPSNLSAINCLAYSDGGARRVAAAMLESVGLLPKQRRAFVSYVQKESRAAALQLFSELSGKQFDVFLDTHSIFKGENFQDALWHRMCDSDIVIMLDTKSYFASRWAEAEFGFALAKDIAILQLVWPGVTPSARTDTTTRLSFRLDEISRSGKGLFSRAALKRIREAIEAARTKSHAVRIVNMTSRIRQAALKVGGTIDGIGANHAVHLNMPGRTNLLVVPKIGVPASSNLHDASVGRERGSVAVVYDHVGLRKGWVEHLDWLGERITDVHWMKECDIGTRLAVWKTL